MSKQKLKLAEDVSPNLVPMIDIMFLLLLFLMLSADMGQRELEEVSLPKAVSVKDDKDAKKGPDNDRLTINVYHDRHVKCAPYAAAEKGKDEVCREDRHWKVGVKGKDYSIEEGKLEAMLKKEAALEMSKDPKTPTISERRVMIRADGASPYGKAQEAMNVCARVGIYKIDVGAARPPQERKRGASEH